MTEAAPATTPTVLTPVTASNPAKTASATLDAAP